MSTIPDDDILPYSDLPPIPDLASPLSEALTPTHNDSVASPDAPVSKAPAPDPGATAARHTDPAHASSACASKTLCTICYDAPATEADTAVVPVCGHSFCLPCLISWTSVRPVCPNCKSPFRTVLTCRDPATGSVHDSPVETDAHLLRDAKWLDLREIHSLQHDIEASFTLPPLDDTLNDHTDHAAALLHARAAAAVAAAAAGSPRAPRSRPVAIEDEEVEEELEQRFWEDEQDQHDRLMRSTRVIHNRRYGSAGYIAAGRAFATPRRVPNGPSGAAGAAGSASQHASAAAQRRAEKKAGAKATDNQTHTGGRKKKVKKKSRAGIAKEAAAKAAREAAEKEAAAVGGGEAAPDSSSARANSAGAATLTAVASA